MKASDLKVGLTVSTRQLDSIKGIYIILGDARNVLDESDIGYHTEGEILFFGTEQNEAYEKAWDSNNNIVIIHNQDEGSEDIEDGDHIGTL